MSFNLKIPVGEIRRLAVSVAARLVKNEEFIRRLREVLQPETVVEIPEEPLDLEELIDWYVLHGMSLRVARLLGGANIQPKQLPQTTDRRFRAIEGFGKVSLKEVRSFIFRVYPERTQ